MIETDIYLYNRSYLPIEGWFHSCFMCCAITERLIFEEIRVVNNRRYKIYSSLCVNCDNMIDDNNEYRGIYYNNFYRMLNKYYFRV